MGGISPPAYREQSIVIYKGETVLYKGFLEGVEKLIENEKKVQCWFITRCGRRQTNEYVMKQTDE